MLHEADSQSVGTEKQLMQSTQSTEINTENQNTGRY